MGKSRAVGAGGRANVAVSVRMVRDARAVKAERDRQAHEKDQMSKTEAAWLRHLKGGDQNPPPEAA